MFVHTVIVLCIQWLCCAYSDCAVRTVIVLCVQWLCCAYSDCAVCSWISLIEILFVNMCPIPWPYMALIPIWELSVMTHTGSFLLKSTGFNIGNHIAITLMLWKHLSSSSVHWKVWLFCTDPDYGVVYAVISGMYSARHCISPIQHVYRCHQGHVPDNLSCLRISQVLTLINRTVTLWVIGALSWCALYAL